MELVVRAEAGLSPVAALLDAEADLVKVARIYEPSVYMLHPYTNPPYNHSTHIRIPTENNPHSFRDTGHTRYLCIYAEYMFGHICAYIYICADTYKHIHVCRYLCIYADVYETSVYMRRRAYPQSPRSWTLKRTSSRSPLYLSIYLSI